MDLGVLKGMWPFISISEREKSKVLCELVLRNVYHFGARRAVEVANTQVFLALNLHLILAIQDSSLFWAYPSCMSGMNLRPESKQPTSSGMHRIWILIWVWVSLLCFFSIVGKYQIKQPWTLFFWGGEAYNCDVGLNFVTELHDKFGDLGKNFLRKEILRLFFMCDLSWGLKPRGMMLFSDIMLPALA